MTTPTPPATDAPAAGMPITVGAQYIKDFSFESPSVPQIFAPTQAQPQIEMGVNLQTRGLSPNNYEVLLMLKLDTKIEGKTAFIAELTYGGAFSLPPMPEEQLKLFLLVECPRILFPFARSIMTSAIREGGFPFVMINPVDFMALYVANKDNIGTMPAAGAA
ncbi:MAG: protein-export chaperone SecB [Alphaproteobacteria bacterium]|nr:protein-export chaperone SecB [Alphaproteobacteria bacterium]